MANIFKNNPRLFLKISSMGEHSTIPMDLYQSINKLFGIFKQFIHDAKINYNSVHLNISLQTITTELKEGYIEEMLSEVTKFLKKIKLINKHDTFTNKSDRDRIHEVNFKKEKNVFYKKIFELINDHVKRSDTLLKNFLKQRTRPLMQAYFEMKINGCIEKDVIRKMTTAQTSDDKNTRNNPIFRINPESSSFNKSLFGQLEQDFFSAIRKNVDSMIILSFYKIFANCIAKSKPKSILERVTLSNNFSYSVLGSFHAIVFVRLANRSQARLIRQKTEDATQTKGQSIPEKVVRKLEFPNINSSALELQEITCNGVRADKILNLEGYQAIYDELEKIRKLCGFIGKRNHDKIDDKMIAILIRKIITNRSLEELNILNKPSKKMLCQFLANFTYVFFISESTRNPSCWIIHQIILDLIIEGELSWEQVLTENKSKTLPMAAKSAVQGARYLSNQYWMDGVQPRYYCYPGENDKGETISKQISKREKKFITDWLEVKKKKNSVEEAAKVMCEAVKNWYDVHIQLKPSAQFSLLRTCDWLIAYRREKELYKLLENATVNNLKKDQMGLIIQYCKENVVADTLKGPR